MPHRNLGESPSGITSNLRNEPVQARSTARLTRLLDAAAEVIDEIGFERLTTAMVAERAGASIGTVYRYFPDRIALLQSLSIRTTTEFVDEVAQVVRDERHTNWWDAVEASIGLLADSFANRKGFRSLRFGDVIDLRPATSDRTNNSVVAETIAQSLGERFTLDAPELSFHLEVALEIADALLARSFGLEPAGDARFSSEAKAIVRGYLTEKLGIPA